jgi:hypothetical protein
MELSRRGARRGRLTIGIIAELTRIEAVFKNQTFLDMLLHKFKKLLSISIGCFLHIRRGMAVILTE